MVRIPLKALSVNDAYQGRRFKTPELKQFQNDVFLLLQPYAIPKGKLKVHYIFGVSSKNADGDNLIKAFQDIIASTFGFNDKLIYEWRVEKVDVKKGQEFIDFEINSYPHLLP